MSLKFEQMKFKKLLREQGKDYFFKRKVENYFGEGKAEYQKDADGKEIEFKLSGVYHEETGYVRVTTGDTSQTRSKKKPMILCLINSESNALKKDDEVIMSNKLYKINALTDTANWGIFYDISLELIDNGL